MSTIIYSHPAFLTHDTGEGHPERIDRLLQVLSVLDDGEFSRLERRDAPLAARDQVLLVHPEAFIAHIEATAPRAGHSRLDADTVMSEGSLEAAWRAAGALCAAVDAVMTGDALNAFCAVRPPGHHAEPDRAMGFCIFSSIAVAAKHARQAHDITRVAVVDFDVHHGNGTQSAFWHDANCFYASSHQSPFYPGSGAASESGIAGNIVNAPLAAGAGGVEIKAAYENIILPALDSFAPELILISAGFDAHREDPLAQLQLETEDFAWLTDRLAEMAERHCQGRLVSALEGGYNLRALGDSVAAHLRQLIQAAK